MIHPRRKRAVFALLLLVAQASRAGAEDRKTPLVQRAPPQQVPLQTKRSLPKSDPPKTWLGLRLPAFIAFGVGGLGTGGALATRLATSSSLQSAECGSSCMDARISRNETLSTTSTVLAGVAAAGIGTGIVLLLLSPSRPERSNLAPALRLRVSTQKAVAGVVWKF
jgi:hypothetical protein